jgi:hypothetical protein
LPGVFHLSTIEREWPTVHITIVSLNSIERVCSFADGMEFKNYSKWRLTKISTPDPMDFKEWVNGFE